MFVLLPNRQLYFPPGTTVHDIVELKSRYGVVVQSLLSTIDPEYPTSVNGLALDATTPLLPLHTLEALAHVGVHDEAGMKLATQDAPSADRLLTVHVTTQR